MASQLLPRLPVEELVPAVQASVQYAARADVLAATIFAVMDATARTAQTIMAFAHVAEEGLAGIETELLSVHQQIAEKAQAAILKAYDDSLLGTPPYRTNPIRERNKRYAGGVLRGALESADFVQYDAHGVYIGDETILDERARQWKRLNYGAGGAAGGGAATFDVSISNLALHLSEDGGPRPGFTLPRGRWIGAEFYPASELQSEDAPSARLGGRNVGGLTLSGGSRLTTHATPTRGIRGTHFLAAGLRVVAEEIGPAYINIFKTLWKQADAETKAKMTAGTTLKKPGTPVSQALGNRVSP